MTTTEAIQKLHAAGYADARLSSGGVWWTARDGRTFRLGTDYRSQVAETALAILLDADRGE